MYDASKTRELGMIKPPKGGFGDSWWPGAESNHRHKEFQSVKLDRFRFSIIWLSHHVKTLFTKSTYPLYGIDLEGVFD